MVKLVKTLQSLYVMVMAFIHALQSMFFLGTIMFFGMLIYAIFATMMIGRNSSFDDVRIGIDDDTVYDRFGTVARSMYSLFELMTLEGFEMVARPLVEKQPATFLLIGSFIMIFTYGLLNMVVATVVEKTLEQTNAMKEYEEKKKMQEFAQELHSMKDSFTEMDASETGWINLNEFQHALNSNESLTKRLESMGVPVDDAKELFAILDFDGDGKLTITEFVDGIGKLKDGQWENLAVRADVQTIKKDCSRARRNVEDLRSKHAAFQLGVEARLEEQSAILLTQDAILREVLERLGGKAENFPQPTPIEQSASSQSERYSLADCKLMTAISMPESPSVLAPSDAAPAPPGYPPTHLSSVLPPGTPEPQDPGPSMESSETCEGHPTLSLMPMCQAQEANGERDGQTCAPPGILDTAEAA
jgi:hypothetical protein